MVLNCTQPMLFRFIERVVVPALEAASSDAVPLLELDVYGFPPAIRAPDLQAIAALVKQRAAAAVASTTALPATPWRSNTPLQRDPCFCRFVTQPAKGLAGLERRAARTAVHLRTGFADAQPAVLRRVASSAQQARAWVVAACGREDPFRESGGAFILSDSPGLARFLAHGHSLDSSVRPVRPGAAAALGTLPCYSHGATSRSWRAPGACGAAAKEAALDDLVIGGLARRLHVAPQLAISRAEGSVGTLEKPHVSSFVAPLLLRSMCLVGGVRLAVPECPDYARVFPRDLPHWLQLRPDRSWARLDGRTSHKQINFSQTAAQRPGDARLLLQRSFSRAALRHPCANESAADCYVSFLSAMK